jgi:ABC-type iron transport system FetAB permease component
MQRVADIVFWLALMLWFALAIVGGVAAMAIFPAARELPLSMAGYESFIAAEPALGRQLVAGFLVERVFDLAQQPRLMLATIAAAALVAQCWFAYRAETREPLRGLRVAAFACAFVALVVSLVAVASFRGIDKKYRVLASEERFRAEALATKPFVDDAHAFASRATTAEVVSLLALAGLTAAGIGGRRRA